MNKKSWSNNVIFVSGAAVLLICAIVLVFFSLQTALVLFVLSGLMLWFGRKAIKRFARIIGIISKHSRIIEKENTQTDDGSSDADTAGADNGLLTQFDHLDMITTSAIAIMLSDANAKAASPFIKTLDKPDIKVLLLAFLKDTYHINDIRQINELFSSSYYKRKIKRHMKKIVTFVRRGISYSLPRKNIWIISRMKISSAQSKAYLDKICQSISSFESVKFIPALSGNEELSGSKRNYKLDHLNDCYKDALIYLVDLLLTCTCISKMLFVERMIQKLPADSEFSRIIENLAGTLDDHNLIINKSRPIYQQYYQAELGYIRSDDLLYGMAVTIMVNKLKRTQIKDIELLALDFIPENSRMLDENMKKWLGGLAEKDCVSDVGALILQRITLLIKNNYDMLLTALGELLNWETYYGQQIVFYQRQRDKERYLKGDLNKEILEMSEFKR